MVKRFKGFLCSRQRAVPTVWTTSGKGLPQPKTPPVTVMPRFDNAGRVADLAYYSPEQTGGNMKISTYTLRKQGTDHYAEALAHYNRAIE